MCFFVVIPFMLNHTLGVILCSSLMLLPLLPLGALTLVFFLCVCACVRVCDAFSCTCMCIYLHDNVSAED